MFETDSEIKPLIFYSTLIVMLFITIIILFIIFYRNKRSFYRKEKEKLTESLKHELLMAKIEVQENTLQHFTRELHDNIGQKLALARIYINRLEAGKTVSAEKQELVSISETLGSAISDLRSVANSLNPDYIAGHGLIDSLTGEAARINQLKIANCTLEVQGEHTDILNKQQELLLFRICQEFIQNSIKHSNCTTIQMKLNFEETGVAMLLTDDGEGFDIDHVFAEGRGSGLRNIFNRAKALGADLTMQTHAGTQLALSLLVSS